MNENEVINLVDTFKAQGKGLMSRDQYLAAALEISKNSPSNLLIFGLGEDASLWVELNKEGRTCFLEDDKDWIEKFDRQKLEIHSVTYNTRAQDHDSINFDTKQLKLDLPDSIKNVQWDLIFVDGPLGHNPPRPYKGPGRMKSIYNAYSLLKKGGTCIVDDMGRLIESRYAIHFFKKENFFKLVERKLGFFRKI